MSLWSRLVRRDPGPAPFVVGVARSGTTLLRLMLDAHPEMSIPPETYFLLPFLRRPASGLSEVGAAEFCRTVTGFHTWPDLGIPPERLEAEVAKLRVFSIAGATRVAYRLYAEERGKSRWGDKTPAYARHMEGIGRILPEARFVHIVRDGRDVALSLRAQWFSPADDAAGLARHWVESIRAAREEGARVRHYMELRFEDLVREPGRTIGEVCRFLELPFDAAMLDYFRGAEARLGEVGDQRLPDGRVITRESRLAKHRLAGSAPDASRIGVWREAMSGEEKAAFVAVAGDLLRELGYDG